jgi:hypothetical protein
MKGGVEDGGGQEEGGRRRLRRADLELH